MIGGIRLSKTSRTKGAAYERHIAKVMREAGWKDAKRHLEFQEDEAGYGRDIDNTEPFAIQCKCWGSTPSISAINEITLSEGYTIPVAILKRTQKKGQDKLEVAVMPLNAFTHMARWYIWMYGEFSTISDRMRIALLDHNLEDMKAELDRLDGELAW